MARLAACLLALSSIRPLAAGVIQGIALENFTGLPLARARVSLSRLDADRLTPIATITASRNGQFVFGSLAEGYYFLSGARRGFAEAKPG